MNPFRGIRLDASRGVGQRGLSAERGEQVNMVRHPAGRFEHAAKTSRDPADVFVQPRTKIIPEDWRAPLGAEDQMVMQTGERLRHKRGPERNRRKTTYRQTRFSLERGASQ